MRQSRLRCSANGTRSSLYDGFITEMIGGGLRQLFQDRPVLLRLMAVITRQWIDTWREFVVRLHADMETVRRSILRLDTLDRVEHVAEGLSDPHNGGHSVKVIRFEDGSRIVYKPKDLRLDVTWDDLISKLNQAGPPLLLKTVKAIVRDGYGWTEFLEHKGCEEADDFGRFFERAGAWLALFHCFGGTDFHQENMIAYGEHPVPIDLETVFQPTAHWQKSNDPEAQAYEAAIEIILNSVCTVGLLPGFIRLTNDEMLAIGGMVPYRNFIKSITWDNINSDEMRPAREIKDRSDSPNLPHIGGHYAKLDDHRAKFAKGFGDYARYLIAKRVDGTLSDPFTAFAGLPVRRVLRATNFYYGLIHRLQNFGPMDDGIMWSAQADFVSRFTNWDHATDPFWRLHSAERSALLDLNVPYFLTTSDGNQLSDWTGCLVSTQVVSGIDRARRRLEDLDEKEIEWQLAVVEENANMLSRSAGPRKAPTPSNEPSIRPDAVESRQIFITEANKVAEDLGRYAIRRGTAAAWLGLDQRHSEFGRFVALGPDVYNGNCGIALFLAAHAAVTGMRSSKELALAAIAHLRKNLRSRNAARMVRLLGIGGTAGLGSIIYAFTVMARCLESDSLLEDAHAAAELFTDDLIAGDRRLDVMHGSAGAILGLLSLHRQSRSREILEHAVRCGEHLLAQPRREMGGRLSWIGQGLGSEGPLNGMSHGAAGYAYALASLAAATGREQFADAASECVAFENSSYDAERSNWPDWRKTVSYPWRSQWCHGATGIGLARLATMKLGVLDHGLLRRDVDNALAGAEREWPGRTDTMCCGTLGNIEFFRTAGQVMSRDDLSKMASKRLLDVLGAASSNGGYRWYGTQRAFNLGLFLGLAGVGYTCLRQVDSSVPNVLIWE
ncbi:lanthionine synthetase [Labrys miyagiensis]|uniref:Lanthionine synthetase n=2 Tax=Labrys miyagiensis TaxID=346912 RepID=A0ABQ6CRT6_9HYPH|nr:lanthionine synthetase [Labrys miyagiensis]